jgi:hypothetical protein
MITAKEKHLKTFEDRYLKEDLQANNPETRRAPHGGTS